MMETKDNVPAGMTLVSVRDIETITNSVALLSGDVVNTRAKLDALRAAAVEAIAAHGARDAAGCGYDARVNAAMCALAVAVEASR